jgi:hypothetical protein
MTDKNEIVDMGGYTPLPISERLPSLSEIGSSESTEIVTRGIGATMLDDMHLSEQLQIAQRAEESGLLEAIIDLGEAQG